MVDDIQGDLPEAIRKIRTQWNQGGALVGNGTRRGRCYVSTGMPGGELNRSHARLILNRIRQFLGYSPPPLMDLLIKDAQKVHRQRLVLQERLATGIQPRTAEVA